MSLHDKAKEEHPVEQKESRSLLLWRLCRSFFVIGGFTFGGGYAMIEMIRDTVVEKYHWLEDEEFVDLLALTQSLPGVFAVNISIFIGMRLAGPLGALLAGISATLPSFTIMLLIAIFAVSYGDNPTVNAIFNGIRPAVVALIVAPVVKLWKGLRLPYYWLWIPIASALLIWLVGISPVVVILVGALGGWFYTIVLKQSVKYIGDNDKEGK